MGENKHNDSVEKQNMELVINEILEKYSDYFESVRQLGLSKFLPKIWVNSARIESMLKQGLSEIQIINTLITPIEDIFRDGDILVEMNKIYIVESRRIKPISLDKLLSLHRDALAVRADKPVTSNKTKLVESAYGVQKQKYRHLDPCEVIIDANDIYVGVNATNTSARKLLGSFEYPAKLIRVDKKDNKDYTIRDIWKDVIVSTISLIGNFDKLTYKLYKNMDIAEVVNMLSGMRELSKYNYDMRVAIGRLVKKGLSNENAKELHWFLPGLYYIDFGGAPDNNPNYFSYIKISMIIRMYKDSFRQKLDYSEQLSIANKQLKNINKIVGELVMMHPRFKRSGMKLSYFDAEKMVTKSSTIDYILTLRISDEFKEKAKDYINSISET